MTLISPGEGMLQVKTDDSSRCSASLDTGTYNIVVETWHTWPDTLYDVRIPGDTFMDIQIPYDYLILDTLTIYFRYEPASDSLSEIDEGFYLDSLSRLMGGYYSSIRR